MTSPTSQSESPVYVLKVARGATKHPERPVLGERFLIGAGSNCQLQLGGETPILHSIIITTKDQLWIDAVVPVPALIINGRSVRESVLSEGDIIEIGAFRFELGLAKISKPQQLEIPTNAAQVSNYSASELVELIEAELLEVEQKTSKQELGATALLKAARAANEEVQTEAVEELIERLKSRAAELDHREALLTEHADRLEKTQRELQEQLEIITEELSETDDPPHLRLTA